MSNAYKLYKDAFKHPKNQQNKNKHYTSTFLANSKSTAAIKSLNLQYTETNPPPVKTEDLESTYNIPMTTNLIGNMKLHYETTNNEITTSDYDDDYDADSYSDTIDDCDETEEHYIPGVYDYEAYKPDFSLTKMPQQEPKAYNISDTKVMTRLERITAGMEKDPYLAHRQSYKGQCEQEQPDGLEWAINLQKPEPTIGIEEQSGEEFEIWSSMAENYLLKK